MIRGKLFHRKLENSIFFNFIFRLPFIETTFMWSTNHRMLPFKNQTRMNANWKFIVEMDLNSYLLHNKLLSLMLGKNLLVLLKARFDCYANTWLSQGLKATGSWPLADFDWKERIFRIKTRTSIFPKLVRKVVGECGGKHEESFPPFLQSFTLKIFRKLSSPRRKVSSWRFRILPLPTRTRRRLRNQIRAERSEIFFRTSQIASQFILALDCARKCIVACSVRPSTPNQFVKRLEKCIVSSIINFDRKEKRKVRIIRGSMKQHISTRGGRSKVEINKTKGKLRFITRSTCKSSDENRSRKEKNPWKECSNVCI